MLYEFHNPRAGRATEKVAECHLLMFVPGGHGAADIDDVAVLDARGDCTLTDRLDFTEGVEAFGLEWCRIPSPTPGLWRVQVVAIYDEAGEIATLQFETIERADCPVAL